MSALPVDDVVASQRHRVDRTRHLHLPDHVFVAAECDLRPGEVEFPHPAKALVVKLAYLLAIGLKALLPRTQSLGVMETQDFDVGDPQAGLLDRREDLGQSGRIAAREDVFADPR